MNNGPLYALAPAFGISFFTQSTRCPLCMHALPVHMQIRMFVYCYEFWLRITKPSPPQTSCVTWNMSFISLSLSLYIYLWWDNLGELPNSWAWLCAPTYWGQDIRTHSSSCLCCTFSNQKPEHDNHKEPRCVWSWLPEQPRKSAFHFPKSSCETLVKLCALIS